MAALTQLPGEFAWPRARLAEAIDALAGHAGLPSRPLTAAAAPPDDDRSLEHWMEDASSWMGVAIEPAQTRVGDVERFLETAGPSLLRLDDGDESRFLALIGRQGRRLSVLAPDLVVHRVPAAQVRCALCGKLETPLTESIDRLLTAAEVRTSRRHRVRSALLAERLGPQRIDAGWLLDLPTSASFWSQLQRAGLPQRLLAVAAGHASQYFLYLLAWWMVGRGALQGRFDPGWLFAWALLLLTLVPLRAYVTWSLGLFSIGAGGLLKKRLLAGALRLEPEEIRHQGVGQLLGRVIESEAVESLALSGGFLGLIATIELVMAAGVLALGAGGIVHAILLLGWAIATVLVGRLYYRRRRRWTESRLDITHDLVEQMVGHRTRLAQQPRERWHVGEDQALAQFFEKSRLLDRTGALIVSAVPRGWLVLGLLGLAPAFVGGEASTGSLAVGLGGTLLAFQALDKLAGSVFHLSGAAIAWQQVSELFRSAARRRWVVPPAPDTSDVAEGVPLIDASELVFRYRDRGEPVIRGCDLRIDRGDRVLLEGPSGGGKSTLAALIAGLRRPESGLVLLDGLDPQTVGANGWRRRIAVVPQFHENYVLGETFAFNLLMGRRWPPAPEDLAEAETLCHELGLGELLERMPAGLLQQVGETGWQLSHGERSRLYIARALLQHADLLILDESFAALDPQNLQRCLRCVLAHSQTVLVIAHP